MYIIHCSYQSLEKIRDRAKSASAEENNNIKIIKELLSNFQVSWNNESLSKLIPDAEIQMRKNKLAKYFGFSKPPIESNLVENISFKLSQYEMLHINHDLLFMHKQDDFCKNIYRNFGLYVIGVKIDFTKLNILKTQFTKPIHPNDINSQFRNWLYLEDYLIKGTCVVIKDKYFNNLSDKNMRDLFKTLLTCELSQIPYQITLLTDLSGNKSRILNKLKNNLPEFVDSSLCEFEIEQIFEVEHERIILGNYFMLISGHGFDLFNDSNRAKQESNVSLDGIFNCRKNLYSPTLVVHEHVETLKFNVKKHFNKYISRNRLLA